MNFFELFGFEEAFIVDKNEVKKKYFALSKKYHPDFIIDGTEEEKQTALEMSSIINKAYKTFLNEDELMAYLLKQKNVLIEDEKYDLPKDFLMEMMELNESLMDAKLENNLNKVNDFKHQINHFEAELKKSIEDVLNLGTIANTSIEDLKRVKDFYFKKKYLKRILDSTM